MTQHLPRKLTALSLVLLLLLTLALPAGAAGSRFQDVSPGDWYYDAVEFVTQQGLFQGTSATAFSPDQTMDRGMFVTVLGRMAGVDTADYDKVLYEDAPRSAYFAPYVQWGAAYGIVNGTGKYVFSPSQKITRQDIVTQLYRYAVATENDVTYDPHALDGFSDQKTVESYAQTPMRWAVTHKIIQGSGGRLSPKDTATRAQVAQLFYNSRDFFVSGEIAMDPQVVEELPEILHPKFPRTGDRIKDLLNSARLIPTKTGTSLDKTVDKVFSQIFKKGMTTYDKVKACYDYLITHTTYGHNEVSEDPEYPEGFALSMWDGTRVFFAHGLLETGIGVCDDYAAAFLIMTRRIGLETYVNGGTIGGQGHAWNTMKINGKYYLFDAQVEDNIANNNGGEIQYLLFCQDPNPEGFNYKSEYKNMAEMESQFNGFRNVNFQPLNDIRMQAASTYDDQGNRTGEFLLSPLPVSKLYGNPWRLDSDGYTIELLKATDGRGNEIPMDPEDPPQGLYVYRNYSSFPDDPEKYYRNEWVLHTTAQGDETYFLTFRAESTGGAKITRTLDVVLPRDGTVYE